MKQYLKMEDYFVGGVSARLNGYGDVVVDYDCADPDMIVKKTMLAIEHAINSHDELVQMNQELLAALEDMLHNSSPPYSGDTATDSDFESRYRAISQLAIAVIAKAKGGAA